MRKHKIIILVLSLLMTLVYVQGFKVPTADASTLYQGDLILTGNNVTTIEGRFDINGSILVEDNATLYLKNAILDFNQSQPNQYIRFMHPSNGNPRFIAENSTITRYYLMTIYFHGNSTATINNSTIYCNFDCGSNSVTSISNNSDIDGTCYSRKSSTLNMHNSRIERLQSHEDCAVEIYDSELDYLSTRAISVNCTISKLEPGLVSYWNFVSNCSVDVLSGDSTPNLSLTNTNVNRWTFDFYGTSNATISNSIIGSVYARDSSVLSFKSSTNQYIYAGSSALLFIEDSQFTEIRPYDNSTWWLLNTTYNKIYPRLSYLGKLYVSWYLDVHIVDSIDQNVPSASVTLTYPNSTVADSKLTDANGWASFSLMEKIVNASDTDYIAGEHPVGDYTVEATYESYLDETTVNMTENKEATLTFWGFIVPEFPSWIILPLFVTATLAVIIYRRKLQK